MLKEAVINEIRNAALRTLVLGLGNPALGDDGVGWQVAGQVQAILGALSSVTFLCLTAGGYGLMEKMIGYDRAILIDAFASDAAFGSVMILRLADLPNYTAFHVPSSQDTPLQDAMLMGRAVGAHLPSEVKIIGVTIPRELEFHHGLSEPVAAAVPFAVRQVLNLLRQEG